MVRSILTNFIILLVILTNFSFFCPFFVDTERAHGWRVGGRAHSRRGGRVRIILINFIILLVIVTNFIYFLWALKGVMVEGVEGSVRLILKNFIILLVILTNFSFL